MQNSPLWDCLWEAKGGVIDSVLKGDEVNDCFIRKFIL